MDKLNNELLVKHLERVRRYREYEGRILGLKREEDTKLVSLTTSNALEVVKYNELVHNRYLTKNNSLRFIDNSKEHLICIVNLIKNARKFIHIEYYIFSEGYIFNYLIQLLSEKVQEGVEVRLIVDGWGNCFKISAKTLKRLRMLGIHYKIFNPLFRKGELWWNFRNHNKLLIIDNEYALFGSCNISDEYFNITDKFFPTSEISVLLEGEIVNSLNFLFYFHWNMIEVEGKEFDLLLDSKYYFPINTKSKGNLEVQLISSSPLLEDRPIKINLFYLIFSAKKSIKISTPYFYPPQDILSALKTMSQSGIKVQIILPKEADLNDRVLRVHRKLLSNLLFTNIEFYEYFGFNHEKLLIIDEETVYLGTYNWDYRSFYWNFESSLVIKNRKVGETINRLFLERLKKSHLINLSDLKYNNKVLPNIFTGISRWCQAFT